jgi:endo-1,4-beta-xylanase
VDSLNATALANGMMFGAAAASQVMTDPQYGALYQQHCGIITTDIALKWGTVRQTSMTPSWTEADALLAWAEASNIQVKGHNLIWNEYNPAWLWTDNTTAPDYGALTAPVTVAQAQWYFDKHIVETVGRFAGSIHIWDVVNEPIELSHGRADGMRSKTWMAVYGPKYVNRAFVRAHEADPTAKLFLNEQSLEKFANETHRAKFLALVDQLLDAGTPLHGIGFESHLIMWAGATHEGVMWLLQELQSRNLEVHISELDIQHYGGSGQSVPTSVTDPAVIDDAVANFVRPFLKDMLSFPHVKALITWQLADKYSWLKNTNPRPLPFDNNYQPKAMAFEIERALQNRRAG